MAFPLEVADEAMVACKRFCAICEKQCGTNIELHHIVPSAKGGEDVFSNCIPLCFECHAEVEHYNSCHPKGRKFTKSELTKRRDDFYTKIPVYPRSYGANTFYDFPTTNNTRRFKFDSSFNLYTIGYVGGIPSAEILEGTITENQEYTASGVGCHGFNKSDWTVLRNFPMWTVLDGAVTGCLRPAEKASSSANFVFYSNQLDGEYFAQFDANGNLDLDPTKTFVPNLPFLTVNVG